jgi:hypothetical protein
VEVPAVPVGPVHHRGDAQSPGGKLGRHEASTAWEAGIVPADGNVEGDGRRKAFRTVDSYSTVDAQLPSLLTGGTLPPVPFSTLRPGRPSALLKVRLAFLRRLATATDRRPRRRTLASGHHLPRRTACRTAPASPRHVIVVRCGRCGRAYCPTGADWGELCGVCLAAEIEGLLAQGAFDRSRKPALRAGEQRLGALDTPVAPSPRRQEGQLRA